MSVLEIYKRDVFFLNAYSIYWATLALLNILVRNFMANLQFSCSRIYTAHLARGHRGRRDNWNGRYVVCDRNVMHLIEPANLCADYLDLLHSDEKVDYFSSIQGETGRLAMDTVTSLLGAGIKQSSLIEFFSHDIIPSSLHSVWRFVL